MTPRTSAFGELRTAAGWHFFVIAFLGRLPVAMNVVGVLTLVAVARGSLAEAGIASATLGIASGIGAPLLGAAADRWGQRPVLTAVALVNTTALIGVVSAAFAEVPLVVLSAACLLAGATIPQISSMARTRWMALLVGDDRSRRRMSAAMSYEGMADELSFVGGPVLVGVLGAGFGPAVPMLTAAAITLVFVLAFAWHPTAAAVRPHPHPAAPGPAGRPLLLRPLVALPIGGMFFMGAFFGAALVALTAFLRAQGLEEQTGLVYGCMGVTSAVSAVALVALPERVSLATRWAVSASVLVVAAVCMSFVDTVWGMILVLLLVGAAAGALLVTLNSAGAAAAPPRRMATTMTLLASGIIVGQAIASAVTGGLAEHLGFAAAAGCLLAAAVGGVLVAALNILVVRRTRASASSDRLEGEPA